MTLGCCIYEKEHCEISNIHKGTGDEYWFYISPIAEKTFGKWVTQNDVLLEEVKDFVKEIKNLKWVVEYNG